MFNKIRAFANKENLTVAYKLLVDSLFILFVVFILAMLAEGVLPGIVASHIGLYKIALLIMVDVLAISMLAKMATIPERSLQNKKIAWTLFFILGILIFNSLLKLNIFLNVFILLLTFATVYFLFKAFQEE